MTNHAGTRRRTLVVVGAVLVAVGLWSGVPSTAFTQGVAARSANVDVAQDERAALGVDVNRPLCVGGTTRLVTVTNRLQTPVTVTVALVDGSDGTLSLAGLGDSGDAVRFSLVTGASQRVDISVRGATRDVAVDIAAAAAGASASLSRWTYTSSRGDRRCSG